MGDRGAKTDHSQFAVTSTTGVRRDRSETRPLLPTPTTPGCTPHASDD